MAIESLKVWLGGPPRPPPNNRVKRSADYLNGVKEVKGYKFKAKQQ